MARRTKEQMLDMVRRFSDYSGTKKEFCAMEQVNLYTFTYWQKKVEVPRPTTDSKFREIKVPNQEFDATGYHFVFSNGHSLTLPSTTPIDILQTLLQTIVL